ncbi:MAG: squalene/phytoene synthase family protein [Polyangiales bacterium]
MTSDQGPGRPRLRLVSDGHDVVIVGAGPVGSLAAIAFASRGARVLLLEANPQAAARFAGEWIHPPGVGVLDRLRVGRLEVGGARTGYGFAVLPDDGGAPVQLPYPDGKTALACEHSRIVDAIRDHACACDGVEYRPHTRVTRVEGQRLWAEDRRAGRMLELRAERIVGADGRKSSLAAAIGGAASTVLSHMASVELTDARLPFEGFGHVILGGPGPVLMYRIAEDRVRVCLDVPLREGPSSRTRGFLWERFGPIMPPAIAPRLRAALQDGPLLWAATRFAPRTAFGQGALALVGDAVGHLHPLTAAGLTQGFLDAEVLAGSASIDAYQQRREAESYVPELLGNALYEVFSRDDECATAIRRAVYRAWRASPSECKRTMRILMGEDRVPLSFASSFTRMAFGAVSETLAERARAGELGAIAPALSAYWPWAKWPLLSLLPAPARRRYRKQSAGREPAAAPPRAETAAPSIAPAARTSRTSERVSKSPIVGGDVRDDWELCVRSLQAVSRTFSRPIAMLPHELEVAVTCGYLLCRIADTIEDHPGLALHTRDAMFGQLLAVLEQGTDPSALAARFAAISGQDAELELARNLPRVMRVWGALDEAAQEACRRWIPEMIRGMQLYTHRKPGDDQLFVLHTIEDLERYCYFVAGTVGRMLTDLFAAHLQEQLPAGRLRILRDHAEHFGAGLQLVNVLKDVTEDRARSVCFIPESVCAAQDLRASELIDPDKRYRAHAAVEEVFEVARRHLRDALEYSLAIPGDQTGIRMFCLTPLWMAVRTLVLARGNDALFVAGSAVKISRTEVAHLIACCTRDVADDEALRAAFAELWRGGAFDEPGAREERSVAGGRHADRGY